MPTLAQSPQPTTSKRRQPPSRLGGLHGYFPKEFAARIAERHGNGLPLTLCLDLEPKEITLERFNHELERSSGFRRVYRQRLAEVLSANLEQIRATSLRTMPALVWIMERAFPQYFGPPKARDTGNQLTVNVGIALPGCNAKVLERARSIVHRDHKRAALRSKERGIVDVEAEVSAAPACGSDTATCSVPAVKTSQAEPQSQNPQ